MKPQPLYFFGVFAIAAVIIITFNSTTMAHGIGYRMNKTAKTVVVEFFYATGSPMSYAQILVWSPENNKVEFQNGRTDQNGRFAFSPSQSGTWHIDVNDGRGHKKKAALKIEPTSNGIFKVESKKAGLKIPALRLILGLSLIYNIAVTIIIVRKD